jgi:uncharacterized membrane protein
MPPFRPLIACAIASAIGVSAPPAQAAFLFCNKTQTLVEAAFGYREQIEWISEGWWKIEPGQCARVFSAPLMQRFYFYFARVLAPPSPDGKPPTTWAGKFSFCIDTKAFKIQGDGSCESRGFQEKGFQEIDIGTGKHDYTLNFEDGKNR